MTNVLGLAALACFAGASAALILLHVLPSPADPVSEGVSAYALGPTARGYQAQAIVAGLGALLLAGALVQSGVAPVAVACLVAYGLTRIAIVAFPTDPRGSTMTTTGRNHALLAAVAFLAIAFGAPIASPLPIASASVAGVAGYLVPLAWLVTGTSLASFAVAAIPGTVRFYGIAQRLFHLASLAWLIAASVVVATA